MWRKDGYYFLDCYAVLRYLGYAVLENQLIQPVLCETSIQSLLESTAD